MHLELTISIAGIVVAIGSGIIAWLQLIRTPKSSSRLGNLVSTPKVNKSVTAPPILQPPYGRLPEHVRGRDHLLAGLRETVRHPDGNVHVITGMGGVGKSAVALKIADYAMRLGREAWWVSSSNTNSLTSTLLGLARYLGASTSEVEECLAGIRNSSDLLWLYLQSRHGWVLVIDNVDDIEELTIGDRLVADGNGWLRASQGGLLLVTSRSSDPSRWGRQAHIHKLDVLPRSESAQILLDLAPGAGPRDSAGQLAEKLGGLPLALRHAGLYLVQPFVTERTFEEYLTELLGGAPELMVSQPEVQGDERTSLRSTWDLSLSLLERQGIGDARQTLRLLSMCSAPNPIPLIIIQIAVRKGVLSPDILTRTLQALATIGLLADQELSQQPRRHLASNQMVGLHPLVAEGLRYDSTTSEISESIQSFIEIVDVAITDLDQSDPATWSIWISLVPHLSFVLANPITKSLGERVDSQLLHICARVISALATASEHPKSEELVEQVRPFVSIFPKESIVTLTARYCIAYAARTRSFSTVGGDEFRDILDLQEKSLGKDHPDTLHTRHNLAHVLATTGRLDEAIVQFEETISGRARTLGATAEATMYSRRALLYHLIRGGRAAEAKRQLSTIAQLAGKLWDINYPPALSLRYNAAQIRIIERDINELDVELKDVLQRQIAVLGEEHNSSLETRVTLADVYSLQGRIDMANAELQTVLSYRQAALGEHHPVVRSIEEKLESMKLDS